MATNAPHPEPVRPKRIWPWVAVWLVVAGMVAVWIAAIYIVVWHPPGSLIELPKIFDLLVR